MESQNLGEQVKNWHWKKY